MAFWNREELPPELKDKKPEEIAEAMKKLKDLEMTRNADFEKQKSEYEEKLKQQSDRSDQMAAKLQEWEQAAAQAQQQFRDQQAPQEPTSPWTDPDRYIDERTRGTQVAALGAARMAARLTFQQNLAPREQKIFSKYANEIDRTMDTYHPMAQGMPQNWNTAFIYIKGLHEQEISKMESQATPFFSEPGSRGQEQEEPKPQDKLTAEEEEAVKKFHWSPEGYLKQKQRMNLLQSERGAYARFPVPERGNKVQK